MARTLAVPFQIGSLGAPRTAGRKVAARQQIEQLLFTLPGERVNRPDFGCGVQRLVFSGASDEAAAATEYVIKVALQKFLADILTVDAVQVTVDDVTLSVDILYTLVATGDELADTFRRSLEAPR
jgi:phage baseplate assembly protein W